MAETTTIARPYAQAAFELAREQNALGQWADMLRLAATVARDPAMAELVSSPRIERGRLAQLLIDICGQQLTADGQNFIRLLAENRRLPVLAEIAELFDRLRADAEGVLEAEMISALPVDDAQRAQIAAALKARLKREVTLTCKTDASLLGGAVIRAGDLVIDGSVKGRLAKLASALHH